MTNLYNTVSALNDLESTCRAHFGTNIRVKRIIARDVPTGNKSFTTVFESTKHDTYAFCQSDIPLTLADIKRIIRGMGMEASSFIPPENNPSYFTDFGKHAFKTAFPGRLLHPNDDISYYTSLAPYTPALVKISRVKGEIRQFIPSTKRWYKTLAYSYARVEVQS